MVLPHRQRAYLYWGVRKELKNSRTQELKNSEIEAKETFGIQRRGAKPRRRREQKTHLIRVLFLDSWVLEYLGTRVLISSHDADTAHHLQIQDGGSTLEFPHSR